MDIDINWKPTRTQKRSDAKDEKAVVYARFSSHSQGEQSIEGQLAAARAYATARGYSIIHEYIDRAMTGKNDNRDDFQRMLSDCAKKQFSVIIVWKVDRFGRNREEITFNKYRAKKHGVRVEYVAENLPDSPEGVILESVLEGMAEYYSLQLSQNIRRGTRENAKKCKFSGGRIPLGYKLDENKKFIIDEETAPIVRLIYKKYAEGQTIQEIINYLNSQGLKTSVGRPYTKSSLRTVLKNEKYIGIYDFKNGEIRIEGGVPAIVDDETFIKVQKLLQINQRAPASKWSRGDYILTGKLYCGTCGSIMTGESGTSKTGAKHHYYICVDRKKRKKGSCTRKAIRKEWIEDNVLSRVQTLVQDNELMEFIAENTWQYYLAQDERQDRIRAIQHQLDDINRSINNIMRAVEAGMFNDTMKDRMDELSAQKTELTSAIASAELEAGFRLTKDHIVFFLDQFRHMDTKDTECVHRLVDIFINSIYVYDDKIIINFNFSGDSQTITLSDMEKLTDGRVFVHRALRSTMENDGKYH